MADEFQSGICSGNWWDSSRNRFDIESASVSASFQDTQKLQGSNLQVMGLGLSSQPMDWNQALLRGGKTESGFGSMLQEESGGSNTNFQQEQVGYGYEDSSVNRGFSLDQPQFSSHGTTNPSFQMDPAVIYGSNPPPTMLQGFLVSSDHHHPPQQSSFENRSGSYSYPQNYGMQFSNTPVWNSPAASSNNVPSSFFPQLQTQFHPPTFDEKPKNTGEVRSSSSVLKKTSGEPGTKRPRSEIPTTLPPFKVRKEKMGDRITALQQLVSPFGKTDTASVLSEAIEYIKFLHEQVSVLSTPYMKSGAPIQQQQTYDKSKVDPEGLRSLELRSRGLCLVPVPNIFPVTHEATVDFWTPTFGGTFR